MKIPGIRRWTVLTLFAGALIRPLDAATILLQPVADTTLVEIAPDNNMGATLFVNAGTAGSAGLRNRGLFKFDFTAIPAHSKIVSAAITLEVTKAPDSGGQSSSFALHRVLHAWGEGDKDSTEKPSPGFGLPATVGEATWNARFAFTTNAWGFPGASNDYAPAVSSSTSVFGEADFPLFASTPQLVGDVQTWVNNPGLNFGWLLKSESESIQKTARRFGSREFAGADPNSPPHVVVEFVLPPALFNVGVTNGRVQFSFLAESNQTYVAEFKNALTPAGSWLLLTNINAPIASTNISVSDAVSTNTRFYRVVLP